MNKFKVGDILLYHTGKIVIEVLGVPRTNDSKTANQYTLKDCYKVKILYSSENQKSVSNTITAHYTVMEQAYTRISTRGLSPLLCKLYGLE